MCSFNETCDSQETTHFIEYFSADWCNLVLSSQRNLLHSTEPIRPSFSIIHLLQTFTSTQNPTLGCMKPTDFGAYPDVVLNAQKVACWSVESNELASTLRRFHSRMGGFLNLNLTDGNLSWQADDGHVVRLDHKKSTSRIHERRSAARSHRPRLCKRNKRSLQYHEQHE